MKKLKPLKTINKGGPIKIMRPNTITPVSQTQNEVQKDEELNIADCEIGKANLKSNHNDALKQQEELIRTMQQAKQDYDIYIEDPEEDDMEKEFLQSMSNELKSNTDYNQADQYTEALSKLEEIKNNQKDIEEVKLPNQNVNEEFGQLDDDLEQQIMSDNQHLMKGDKGESHEVGSGFKQKYDNLIQEFSIAIENKKNLPLKEVSNITDKVWSLVDEWRDQSISDTQRLYKETLIKGVLALIENKNPRAVFRLCRCMIHIINSIFLEKLKLSEDERLDDVEFIKIFASLKSAVQILFRYCKDDKNDELYEQEKIFETLINVLVTYYIDGRNTLVKLTTKIIKKSDKNNVEINNTDAIFDMLIYIVGLFKNSSLSKENQNILHNKNAIQILSSL